MRQPIARKPSALLAADADDDFAEIFSAQHTDERARRARQPVGEIFTIANRTGAHPNADFG